LGPALGVGAGGQWVKAGWGQVLQSGLGCRIAAQVGGQEVEAGL
jgi:hypothetical protein